MPSTPDLPWPHAPPHWLLDAGDYFVTASTYHRERLFDTPEKLNIVTSLLIETAARHGWHLRSWAVFANHYHFLAHSPKTSGESLREWLMDFHRTAATEINKLSQTTGRRVWMNFRESSITHTTSYMARLRYINENAVKHGLVAQGCDYPWCSAAWFEKKAPTSFVKSVARFATDKLEISDDFDGE